MTTTAYREPIAETDQAERPSLLAGLRTGAWLEAQEFPPIRWVVPGLLPEGMSLLIGGPKIGKSWLSLDIALAVASGGRALGKVEVQQRPVLLLALEDGDRRLQGRARRLLGDQPIPARLHYLTRLDHGMVVPTIEEWLDTLEPDAEPLVILDTLGKVMPMAAVGESSYQRDYRVAGRLKRIADDRPGMALLVLHHDRKATSEDFVDGVSGTNGIAGAADTITLLSRSRTEADGLLKVTGRDVAEREYAVTVTEGVWTLDGETLDAAAGAAVESRQTANLGDRSGDIIHLAHQQPDGIRARDVAEHLGMDPKHASEYLRRLHEAGKLNRPERGLYTRVGSVGSVGTILDFPTQPTQPTRGLGDGNPTCRTCDEPSPNHLPGCPVRGGGT